MVFLWLERTKKCQVTNANTTLYILVSKTNAFGTKNYQGCDPSVCQNVHVKKSKLNKPLMKYLTISYLQMVCREALIFRLVILYMCYRSAQPYI